MAKRADLGDDIHKVWREMSAYARRHEVEDMAREMLRSIVAGKKAPKYSTDKRLQVSAAIRLLEDRGYWKIAGGTPKSGAAYSVTEKGMQYLKRYKLI